MGQTLTHGIYLPDEGERNCYDGLASNWQLLDGAVGTIAEHTTALAGKAPAVHTHTKSDITDFPAYGNTAGTICEGNDSRLSDARTPVAHTHTKADVTDLLNSANTWSANNIYTYAITLKQTNLEEGVLPASNQTKRFVITDKNNANLGWLQHRINTSGDSYLEFYVVNKFSNGQLSTQGSEIANVLNLGLHSDGSRYFTVTGDVYPDLPTRVCNLGTSTNKWKTLNGVNPGALSLPSFSIARTDISSSFLYFGNNVTNNYDVTADGYIFLKLDNTNQVTCYDINESSITQYAQTYKRDSDGLLYITFPVLKNTVFRTIWYTNSTVSVQSAYFIPCQGNV